MNIAIIPARGGSKRIPHKNIKEFLGKPIIWYPIKTALKVFDKVVVSTDDYEIAEVSREAGAEVAMRPPELSDDLTPSGIVIAEVAKFYPDYDTIACIYPTAVFTTQDMLVDALKRLGDNDCVFPVVEYGHPIQRALKIDNGLVSFVEPENKNIRTQDLEPRYHDAGQFYIIKREPLIEQRNLYFERMAPIIMKDSAVHDIDTPEDWRTAELKYAIGKER
jgi:pseudaminic acid cytidylyltransferase